MHCLYGLKKAGYDFQLKGGTSLSKGYGIIHRFSEDIDIHINPPEGLNVRTSKNRDKEKDRQSRKDYYDYLAANIRIHGITMIFSVFCKMNGYRDLLARKNISHTKNAASLWRTDERR